MIKCVNCRNEITSKKDLVVGGPRLIGLGRRDALLFTKLDKPYHQACFDLVREKKVNNLPLTPLNLRDLRAAKIWNYFLLVLPLIVIIFSFDTVREISFLWRIVLLFFLTVFYYYYPISTLIFIHKIEKLPLTPES